MTKDELVYALTACDVFGEAMKHQVMLYEDKGPWDKETVPECVVGALQNLKKVLSANDPLELINAATHAAMYCFFIVDNEAEKIMDEQVDDNPMPGFADFLQGLLDTEIVKRKV